MDHIDLKQERESIRSGLTRSNRSILLNSILIVCLALFAIWIAQLARDNAENAENNAAEAYAAEERVKEKLWDAYLAQARVERLSREAGRKERGLAAIQSAAEIRSGPELVSEAVATLAMYDVGEELFFHQGLPINFRTAFNSDLSRYVMVQDRNHITVNDAGTGKPVRRLKLEGDFFAGATFSPDDRHVGACASARLWHFWDAESFELVKKIDFPTYARSMMRPAFHPEDDRIAFCGKDKSISFFALRSDEVQRMDLPLQPNRVSFNADGSLLAIAAEKTLYVARNDTLEILSTNQFSARINQVSWSPREDSLVLALENSEVVLFNPDNLARMLMTGHSAYVADAFFHPRGDVIVSHSWDRSTRFWDVSTGQLMLITRSGKVIRFSRDGDRLAFYKETAGVGAWKFETPVGLSSVNTPLQSKNGVLWVDHHPTMPWLAGCEATGWSVWNAETGKLLEQQQMNNPFSATFSENGERLFVSGRGGLRVYDVEGDGNAIQMTPVSIENQDLEKARVLERSAISRDGNSFVVGGYHTGFVIDPETLEVDFEFGDGFGAMAFSAVSPDSRWLVSTSWKNWGTCLWDLEKKKIVRALVPYASSMEFSPDGELLATSNNRGLQMWEVGGWKLKGQVRISMPSYAPGPVRFSPDGHYVAAAMVPQVISFYEAGRTNEVFRLSNPGNHNNYHICFSRDGRRLFSATQSRAVQIWDLALLRGKVEEMQLDWPLAGEASITTKAETSGLAGVSAMEAQSGNFINILIVLGMLLAIFFGAYTLRQQKQFVAGYEKVEQLAESQNQKLLTQETEIQQSQKMKALGTLAAGVAHDFNNLLSVIGLSNDFLKRGTRGDPDLEEETVAISKAVRQGRQVVESMLGYSRTADPGGRQEFLLCELVEDSVGLLGQQFLGGIRLTLELDRSAPTVRAAKGKVEQILLNLIINASDAMTGNGKLSIKVRHVPAANVEANVLKVPDGTAHVQMLEVSDSGIGISEENQKRIFEPFFTTKNVGAKQGTGLGLSTIFTIAEHEEFGLDVKSVIGEGSRFTVFIPADPGRGSPSDSPIVAM